MRSASASRRRARFGAGVPTLRKAGGLRSRFVMIFVVVAVVGVGATAWASTEQAARVLTDSSREQYAQSLVERVTAAAPGIDYPPDQASLDRLRASAGENALAIYQNTRSASGVFAGPDGAKLPSRDMQELVEDSGEGARVLTERLVIDGTPWLIVGGPVMLSSPDGSRADSGVKIYTAHDLTVVNGELVDLARAGITTSLLVLPIAAGLALLAARGVLTPVRKLSVTARRLADGDLEARTEPRGTDELAELTRTVNEMAESVQTSMVSMAKMQDDAKRFAADVSHELRTPLTTLTAVVEVLDGALEHRDPLTPDDADARESARLAVVETRRLVRMVEDIIEIARFDSQTAPMRREETDLLSLVSNTVRSRGWEDEVQIHAPEARVAVHVDRGRLDLVLANLIGNALKHGAAPVTVSLSRNSGGVSVTVIDSGTGVPQDQRGKIFERFYKSDLSRARSSGSGLGLAIARENTRLHGGDIAVDDAPAGGARFTLWLPDPPAETRRSEGEADET